MEQNLPPLPPVIFENGLYCTYPRHLIPRLQVLVDALCFRHLAYDGFQQLVLCGVRLRRQKAGIILLAPQRAMNNIKSAALEILRESK